MTAKILDLVAYRTAKTLVASPVAAPTSPTKASEENPGEYVKTVGSRFVPGRSALEIAKLIRAEIKAHKGVKCSVRVERYTTGNSSIKVRVFSAPFRVFNAERFAARKANPHASSYSEPRFTAEGRALLDALTALVDSYASSEVGALSDYHRSNFFGDVEVAYELEAAEKAAWEASR